MLKHLEVYIQAQKIIGNYSMIMGVFFVLLAVLLHYFGVNTLFSGLKIGLFVLGIISCTSGYAYKVTEEKLLKSQTELYQKKPDEFNKVEKERMAKVVKNFPNIQYAFIAVIALSLLIIFFTSNSILKGILISVVMLLTGNLIIEKVSKKSIDAYYQKL